MSARVLHGQGGMGHHTAQLELGQCGGARPHGRKFHCTSGNTSHRPAPLSKVGASTGGGTGDRMCRKQHVGIDPSSTTNCAWLLVD